MRAAGCCGSGPSIEGAVVALDPHTGRVLAMSGGFSYRQSKFNRATQAHRQPGSAFKPFVYLAALESGMTPVSIMLDAPISLSQGAGLARWEPENFSNDFLGPITLRVGLERSRNLISVRVAQKVGMDHIIELARRLGLGSQVQRNLAASLGSNEVTPIELAGAYAELVNGGHKIEPVLVERIQDRHGRTIMRADPARLRGLHRRSLGRQPAAGDPQHAAGRRRPPPRLPDGLDAGRRRRARHRQGRAGAGQAAGWQDRHHQRQQGHLVRRLLARSGGGRVGGLRPAASRWVAAPPAPPWRCRSGST